MPDTTAPAFGANELSADAMQRLADFTAPYRVDGRAPIRLDDHDPADLRDLRRADRREARQWLDERTTWLANRQHTLAAQGRWAVLVVLQGRDAAGKDSTIRHVMARMNPQGCNVTAFGVPTSEELKHDFLWRYHRHLPARGDVGVFNRSYYEEALVVRVHRAHLDSQRLPDALTRDGLWDRRLADIRAFEEYLGRNGVLVVKLFLNISRDEQKRRFLKRLEEPEKHWKFASEDIRDRARWDDYTKAYEAVFNATALPDAPWHIVPADNKWFARLVTASILVSEIGKLSLEYPNPFAADPNALAAARRRLANE